METATPDRKGVPDGWLNRYLQSSPAPKAEPFRAVALGATMPRTLMGDAPALALTRIADFDIRTRGAGRSIAAPSDELYAEFESMWKNETFDAIRMLKNADVQGRQPENGARYPSTPYGESLRQIAQLVKADIGLEVAFTDIGGWDTHAAQGGVQGQLALRLREFGDGIAALYRDLGDRMENIVILTMTEFGRTLKQNGSGGTDHGRASALFVAGGGVRGGRVYGRWPGLAREQLFEGRDLAMTTDFRDVFAEVLTGHMKSPNVDRVFPGYGQRAELGLF